MKPETIFYLRHLFGDNASTVKEDIPGAELCRVLYVGSEPVVGIGGGDIRLYREIDYLTFAGLSRMLPADCDFCYRGLRLIGDVSIAIDLPDIIHQTVEKTLDETIIHLACEKQDQGDLERVATEIEAKYQDFLIENISQSVEGILFEQLLRQHLHISFAESVTGGMLASRLINISGASDVISRSFITYGNDAKEEILGVSPKTIQQYGVVSAEAAEQMVRGLARISKADVNVSVTGYAGGNVANPLDGLCYFAILRGDELLVGHQVFQGSRNEVRHQASTYILHKINRFLSSKR